jgi:hypothetical protein
MANPVVNLSYIGNGPSGQGQVIAESTGGPKAKTLYAYGTVVASSSTFSTTTVATINWIDGIQSLSKILVLPVQNIVPNGTANATIYSPFADGSIIQGQSVTITGFTNSVNNGAFTASTVGSNYIVISNTSAVTETNYAATLQQIQGGTPVFVDVFVAGNANDSAAALAGVGAATMYPSGVSNTGFTLHYANVTTTAAAFTFGAIIGFSS